MRRGKTLIHLNDINKIAMLVPILISPKNIFSDKSLVEICSASPKSEDRKEDGPLALIIGLSSMVREPNRFRLSDF